MISSFGHVDLSIRRYSNNMNSEHITYFRLINEKVTMRLNVDGNVGPCAWLDGGNVIGKVLELVSGTQPSCQGSVTRASSHPI